MRDSPCKNSGTGTISGETDIEGHARDANGVDMGADEICEVHNATQDVWYESIQHAIDEANSDDHDVIVVYEWTFKETINFDGNSITVRSTDPNNWRVIEATIVDADDSDANVVTFDSGEDANSILLGLTVTGGKSGLYCDSSSSPTIKRCFVMRNDSAGIKSVSGSPLIVNNKIGENGGDGIHSSSTAPPTIEINLIYKNDANGIAFAAANSAATIRNNGIVDNGAAGIDVASGITAPTISNCVLWGNDSNDLVGCSGTYCCIQRVSEANGTGNIVADPMHVNADANNYNHYSGSPLIGGGDPCQDYEGDADLELRNLAADIGPLSPDPPRYYVDADAPGPHDGSSWTNAFLTLQEALVQPFDSGDEIWVAQGVYTPAAPYSDDRVSSFNLVYGVIVRGGYAGYGEPVPDEQRVHTYETVLSGNVNRVDPDTDKTDNSFHVAISADQAVLDGLTIEGGNADGPEEHKDGGGIWHGGGALSIRNCTLREHSAYFYGGGIYNFGSCDVRYCLFINCDAEAAGGGLYAIESRGVTTIMNTCFIGNSADYEGGGVHFDFATGTIANCVFTDNTSGKGGGLYLGSYDSPRTTTVLNCTFYDNSADNKGGGIFLTNDFATIANSIFWGNTDNYMSHDEYDQIYVWGEYLPITYCCIQDEADDGDIPFGGGGAPYYNTDDNPLFVDADDPCGPDGLFGGYDDGLRLQAGSPCIDAGQDNAPTDIGVPADDLGGNERPFDYPDVDNNGSEDEYDMGAYEALVFRFTVTADNRPGVSGCRARWQYLLDEMEYEVNDEGVFHISPGDIDPPDQTFDDLEDEFGLDVIWFPVVGNHETETSPPDDMPWIRGPGGTDNMGHYGDVRQLEHPEPRIVKEGPTGCVGTMYSFEYHNAHFVVLNEYYNGISDRATTDGYISNATYDWLVEDLRSNKKPMVFVFGHEPVYPKHRHERVPDDDWISFWKLLNDEKVAAYFCGHTHFYSRGKVGGGGLDWEPFTWQVDAGNAGRDDGDGLTFVDVNVTDTDVQFDVWHEDHDDYGTGFEVDDSWALLDLAVPVRDSADDAEESSDGSVNLTDEALELVDNAGDVQTVGLRFREVDIPQGAEIDSAYIQFAADGVTSGTCSLTIEGEKSGNADVFEAIDDNISNETERPRTTASVTWSSVANWDDDERAGVAERTPDIGPIIQEIVGLSGADPWETGNALVIIITGTSGNLRRAFARDAYNAGRDDYAPVLYVKVSR
jgi:hypothetical protein